MNFFCDGDIKYSGKLTQNIIDIYKVDELDLCCVESNENIKIGENVLLTIETNFGPALISSEIGKAMLKEDIIYYQEKINECKKHLENLNG